MGWVEKLPYAVKLDVIDHDVLDRRALWGLAAEVRAGRRPVLDLFWNILAWGGSIGHRTKDRVAARTENRSRRLDIEDKLKKAADLSHDGELANAYDVLHKLLPYWGVAYFTKFIAFTSDNSDPDKPQGIILDDRIRVAWCCLTDGKKFSDELKGSEYAKFCADVGDVAKGVGITPEITEMAPFVFGRRVGTYDKWLEAEVRLLRGDSQLAIAKVLGKFGTDGRTR